MSRVMPEWYRNKRWSNEIEQSFFARLDRARGQRDQYLVIQAIELVDSRPDIALRLIDVYFQSRKDRFHDSRAWNVKAEALRGLGDLQGSVEAYCSALEVERLQPGVTTDSQVEYPYLVALNRLTNYYSHALTTIANSEEIGFPINRFKTHAARAIILHELGKLTEAAVAAQCALQAAEETQSEFRYHRKLGLVSDEHKSVIAQLRLIGDA